MSSAKKSTGEKKSLNLQILKILKDHSDINDKLTLTEIQKYLEKEYDQLGIDTRTINSNIDVLNEYLDDAIEIDVKEMKSKGKTIEKRMGFYINRDFDESELRLIIDSILASKYIPETQSKQLIKKLSNEASPDFGYRKNIVQRITSGLMNEELFTTIEVIGEAIDKHLKITYKYYDFDIDKKMVARVDENTGKERIYTLTPLRLVVNNGRYYVFGVPDINNKLSIYRVDKIKDAEVLGVPGKNKEVVDELKDGKALGKHIAEHIFMSLGPSARVIFEFNKWWISFVVDWFGKDIELVMKDENTCIGSIIVNIDSFENWLMMCSFAEIKVTGPKSVVDRIKARAKKIDDFYNKGISSGLPNGATKVSSKAISKAKSKTSHKKSSKK